jgi:very-short-patch-repair endonuclease
MTVLTQRFQQWAEELVDLSGRNDLISFRQTKSSTLVPSDTGVEKLLNGESVLLPEIIDLEIPENKKSASGVIKDSIEFQEQSGIEVLKLVSKFASWKSDKVSSANAPLCLYSLEIENPGVSLAKTRLRLIDTEPEVNPVFILHLKRRLGIEISDDAIEEAQLEGEEYVAILLRERCPNEIELDIRPGLAIKNLRYQKLPMVKDLLAATDSLAGNTLIAALAGDGEAKVSLRNDVSDARRDEPDQMQPEAEFLIVDADSSQQWAINSALKGQNLVIEGPPGTGKSQTIANLIASYMAIGKTVLFVAEKRAAIDAVKKRIGNVGLDDCFLDLHSAETIRKRPAEPFVKALEGISSVPLLDYKENQTRLESSRDVLVRRSESIQRKCSPWGCSYLEVLEHAIGSKDADATGYSITPNEVNAITASALSDIEKSIEELASLSAWKILTPTSPLSNSVFKGKIRSSEDVKKILDSLDATRAALQEIKSWTSRFDLAAQGNLATCAEIKKVLSDIDTIASDNNLDNSVPQTISEQELRVLEDELSKNLISRLISFLSSQSYRHSLKLIKQSLRNTVKPSLRNLRLATKAYKSIVAIQSKGIPSRLATYPSELQSSLDAANKSLSSLNQYIDQLLGEQAELLLVESVIDQLESIRLLIPNSPRIQTLVDLLRQSGFSDNSLFAQVLQDFSFEQKSSTIHQKVVAAWAERVEEAIRIQCPSLSTSSREYLDRSVRTFRNSDAEHIITNGERIRRITAERAHQTRISHPGQVDLVRQQGNKKRKRMSARRLFAAAPELLKSLKPCWAMSPLVVSELLPSDGPFFDVVIFDEASQIVPYEAITSILRGKQTIVAGDSKQLSPTKTSFFSSSASEDVTALATEDDASFDAVDETESLLDAVKSVLPPLLGVRTLQWHYRSEDERLIAFSNQHPDLYASRLITAPSTSSGAPFVYHLVEGALSEVTGKSPIAEIRQTVELAINHLRTRPDLSLAVIALGQEHARNIQNEFCRQTGDDPNISLFPEGKPEERFVIRHLESIQGDERDVVIIATGYGPRQIGKLRNDFGPINTDKNFFGLRRLNVAITRARKRVEVVSTINPYLYDDNKLNGVGVKAFIQYLRFVHSGGNDLGDLSTERVPMNPFEQDIYDAIVARGIGLVPQYGVSGYRLDFAVQHPEEQGRFVLAIEADGATYHSTETARDRDRIRQNHLERLGWQFHRIWSTEWFRNKEREIELVVSAFEEAVVSRKIPQVIEPPVKRPEQIVSPSRSGFKPTLPTYPSIDDYRGEISAFIVWYCSDGNLRSDDEIFNAVFDELPFGRRGRRIVDRIYADIDALRSAGKIQ